VDDPQLGCPVEYIDLRGSTAERPAVCKYTGNRYYSDDWKGGGGAH
jgi:NADH dehydrogenase (ubiquinone) Fe-S protein 6